MIIPEKEKLFLRDLAKKQMEYASLPIMNKRKIAWTDHNDLKGGNPLVHVELGTFEKELLPGLRCESEMGRQIEVSILRNIANHEYIDDDRVVHDFFLVQWQTWFRPFDINVLKTTPEDSGVGHQFIHSIKNFPEDFLKLGSSTYGVDRGKTIRWKNIVGDVIGDILPVRMSCDSLGASLTQHIVHFMGMEAMIFAMMDYPEEFHLFMSQLADDHIKFFKWLENEELLFLNNGDDHLGQGSFGFSNDLPNRNIGSEKIITQDLWAMMESQETVSISPDMFKEFFFPYYNRVAGLFGLISYGCCEPVHQIWDSCIKQYPNIRKVSISPWCDEEFMGEALQGSRTIFHRKPSPNFMGLDKVFNEEGYRAHILKTLKAARGCKLEFSFRDVYVLCGDLERPRRMVKILREMIDDHWDS
jgi:hypothetical protein